MLIVGLIVDSDVNWDSRNDMNAAASLFIVNSESVCAHSSGIVEYKNGAWRRLSALSETIMLRMEVSLTRAAGLLKLLDTASVARKWSTVFDFI